MQIGRRPSIYATKKKNWESLTEREMGPWYYWTGKTGEFTKYTCRFCEKPIAKSHRHAFILHSMEGVACHWACGIEAKEHVKDLDLIENP